MARGERSGVVELLVRFCSRHGSKNGLHEGGKEKVRSAASPCRHRWSLVVSPRRKTRRAVVRGERLDGNRPRQDKDKETGQRQDKTKSSRNGKGEKGQAKEARGKGRGGKGKAAVRQVRRVSNHTKVDLRIVVDGDVDLLLGLGRPPVILWRVVVGERLGRLLDELVALFLELLAVAVLARVDTPAVIVVLGSGRGRPGLSV